MIPDVAMGMWMAAFNVTLYDDLRLCTTTCTGTSVAVQNQLLCTGCDPKPVFEGFMSNSECQRTIGLIWHANSIPFADIVTPTEPPDVDANGWIALERSNMHFSMLDVNGNILHQD